MLQSTSKPTQNDGNTNLKQLEPLKKATSGSYRGGESGLKIWRSGCGAERRATAFGAGLNLLQIRSKRQTRPLNHHQPHPRISMYCAHGVLSRALMKNNLGLGRTFVPEAGPLGHPEVRRGTTIDGFHLPLYQSPYSSGGLRAMAIWEVH